MVSYGRPLSPWFEKVSFGQRRGIHKVATCELFVLKDRIAIAKSEPEDQDCNAQSASTASEGTDILIILAGSIRVVLQVFLKRADLKGLMARIIMEWGLAVRD